MKSKELKNVFSLIVKLDISYAVCLALGVFFYIATYSTAHIADDIFWVILTLAMLITYYFLREDVIRPLMFLGENSKRINQGLAQKLQNIDSDTPEFAEIIASYNQISLSIERATAFIQQIENGNLDAELSTKEGDSLEMDSLSQALLNMRSTLRKIGAEEKQRNWTTQGVAMLSEILRLNNQDIKTLSRSIMMALVPYLEAIQGAIFALQDEKDDAYVLAMTGMYAYNRQKYVRREIIVGKKYAEDLIGQVFLEKETLHLSKVPEGYLDITSGLGDAPPQNLLFVPLIVDNNIYGVLEIASFQELATYQVEFLERVSESIALTIASVKFNQQTKELLEESQKQAEQLKSQEEEMRQNLEELAATQEEMARKNKELESVNNKVMANAEILKKALQKSEEMQKEVSEKNTQMQAQEEEMRQNLEELQATQDELSRKNKELEERYEEMYAQEEEMRQNLEELVSTQEELARQKEELEIGKKRIEANALVLEKALKKSKEDQEKLKTQNEQIEQQEQMLVKTLEELQKAQEEMLLHQQELELKNKKLITNENILKKFMDRANASDARQKATIRIKEEQIKELEQKLMKYEG